MISKNDIILLLAELEKNGIDTKDDINKTLLSESISLDVLKKINDNMSLDVINFYEKMRKSYNDKKSKLFINIMKSDENILEDDPKTVLTTLTGLLNQVLQYTPVDRTMFYNHMRCNEIIDVLNIYFKSYNLDPAIRLLKLFKADQKVLSMINKK